MPIKVVDGERAPPRVLWTSRCAKQYNELAHIELTRTLLITVWNRAKAVPPCGW